MCNDLRVGEEIRVMTAEEIDNGEAGEKYYLNDTKSTVLKNGNQINLSFNRLGLPCKVIEVIKRTQCARVRFSDNYTETVGIPMLTRGSIPTFSQDLDGYLD